MILQESKDDFQKLFSKSVATTIAGDEHSAPARPHRRSPTRHGGENQSSSFFFGFGFSLYNVNQNSNGFFNYCATFHHHHLIQIFKANLRHANLSNDEKKSEGEDFAGAEKAEEEEGRRSVFARNYRWDKKGWILMAKIYLFSTFLFVNVEST